MTSHNTISKKVGIIGANGSMAQNLLLPLLQKEYSTPIVQIDINSTATELENAWQCDVIWLCVPRETVQKLLENVVLQPSQLIIDIFTFKKNSAQIIEKTEASHLSLHPLHGPFIPLKSQKWAILNNYNTNSPASALMTQTLHILKKNNVNFIECENAENHDTMMELVLGFPEILTLFIHTFLKKYSQKDTNFLKTLYNWNIPASNSLFNYYIHSIASSPIWLREEIIFNKNDELLQTIQEISSTFSSLNKDEVKEIIQLQQQEIHEIQPILTYTIRKQIEDTFSQSNSVLFNTYKSKKPEITVQKSENNQIAKILAKPNVKIGIHGIAGCFTHESIECFLENQNLSLENVELNFLVHGENVMKHVIDGTIDLGVIAVANSGSGVYISSMEVLSKNNFNIMAIYGMEINQCLIANKNITSIDHINTIFGHPQAVSQCKQTLARKYPQLTIEYGKDEDDTALCVERISNNELPMNMATLASQKAAEIYGCTILDYKLQHNSENVTTFLLISKS